MAIRTLNPVWAGACALAAVLAACSPAPDSPTPDDGETSMEDVERETEEAIEAARHLAIQEREAFIRQAGEDYEALKERMSDFRAQLENEYDGVDGDTRARWQSLLEDLDAQRIQARDRLDRLDDASAEAWLDMKAGVEDAVAELTTALDEAAGEAGEPAGSNEEN